MIVPNASVEVRRGDDLVYPALRVQINLYTGDSASGGRRGENQGTLSAHPGANLRQGDVVTIVRWPPLNVLPPLTVYTLGVVVEAGRPARHIVAPLFGGRRQG